MSPARSTSRVLLALALELAACRGRRGAGAPWTGPPLGSARARVEVARTLDAPALSLRSPFERVLLLPSRVLGLAAGELWSLPRGPRAVGGERVDLGAARQEGESVRMLVGAGGERVYVLLEGSSLALARSDDAGVHWTRGASLGPGPLPGAPPRAELAHPELTPAMVARGEQVLFWFQRQAALSRDGGLTAQPFEPNGTLRAATFTPQGTLLALVHSDPPPEDEPVVLLRQPLAGEPTRTALAHTDPCAGGALSLEGTAVLLGDSAMNEHLLAAPVLGTCRRRSTDDGEHFLPLEEPAPPDLVDTRATAAGARFERARGRRWLGGVEVPALLRAQPFDASPEGGLAVGLSHALAYVPSRSAEDLAWLEARWREGDRRGLVAAAAAAQWLVALDGRGTLRWLSRGANGEPEVHSAAAPCRFEAEPAMDSALPLLSVTEGGRVCCASPPGTYDVAPDASLAACATLTAQPLQWEPLPEGTRALRSGEGARIELRGDGARCVPDEGEPFEVRARLGLPAAALLQDASCSGRRALAVLRDGVALQSLAALLQGTWRVRNGAGRSVLEGQGLQERLFLRSDGSALAVRARGERLEVLALRGSGAVGARGAAAWTGRGSVGTIAAWDRRTAVALLPGAVAAGGPGGLRVRPLAEGLRLRGLARVGERLMAVSAEGYFHELRAREE